MRNTLTEANDPQCCPSKELCFSASALSFLPNLGSTSVNWLNEIGINTKADLDEVGVIEAYCLIKAQHDQVSLNLLYALYGALHNMRWYELPPDLKITLQEDMFSFRFGDG